MATVLNELDNLISIFTASQVYTGDDYKADDNISNNEAKLTELVSHFDNKDTKRSTIDSNYLHEPCNITMITQSTNCSLSDCKCLQRITDILSRYHLFINQYVDIINNNDDAKTIDINIYQQNGYKNHHLLNDYNHLLFAHKHEFEEVYTILINNCHNNKICKISDCIMMKRNQRNRSIFKKNDKKLHELYFSQHIVTQQLLDRVHSYFLHSFDIGFKLTSKEKQNMLNVECKTPEHHDNYIYDSNVAGIHQLIQSKRDQYQNVEGLERLNVTDNYNKFMLHIEENKDEPMGTYSYGYRYFYWEYYKNNKSIQDIAHYTMSTVGMSTPPANDINSTVGEWYIEKKFDNFKQEMLLNSICTVGESQWRNLMETAQIHVLSDMVLTMSCQRMESAKYYEMKHGDPVSANHLIAMMLYCNFDQLQFKFSQTFRHENNDETDEEMRNRHRNYHFLGKLLREMVECFGFEYSEKTHITLFHGVSQHFMFFSMSAYIKGPLSTTTDFCVAVGFSNNQGMVLELDMDPLDWRFSYNEGAAAYRKVCCMDCSWISAYSSEQEVFFIGGLYRFMFNTIIECPNGQNYVKYMKGLKQMCYCMSNNPEVNNMPSTMEEKQIVFRLLSHELNRYYPHHKHAHVFESCPAYFRNILHEHFQKVEQMHFFNRTNECKIHEYLFKYDYGWINVHLITKLFPNITAITFDAQEMNISFLKTASIYESMITFLKENYKTTELRVIQIHTLEKYASDIANYTEFYQKDFVKYEWIVYANCIDDINKGSGDSNKKPAAVLRLEAVRNLSPEMAQVVKSTYYN